MGTEVVVAVVFGSLGSGLTVVVYLLQQRSKRLEYAVVAQTRIVTTNADVPEALEVLFDGRPVIDARLLNVVVANQGPRAIASSDFAEGPLRLTVTGAGGAPVRLLTADVRKPRPIDLRPNLSIDGNVVSIEPLLLNRGDRFGVQMLTDGGEATVALEGRLVDVTMREFRHTGLSPWVNVALPAVLGAGTCALVISSLEVVEFVALLTVVALLYLLLFVLDWRAYRRGLITRDLLEQKDEKAS